MSVKMIYYLQYMSPFGDILFTVLHDYDDILVLWNARDIPVEQIMNTILNATNKLWFDMNMYKPKVPDIIV